VVVVLDLNGFKPINDRYGHDAGDRVLCTVAERLSSCAGDNLVARLGGDEFAAVLVSPQVRVSRTPTWMARGGRARSARCRRRSPRRCRLPARR